MHKKVCVIVPFCNLWDMTEAFVKHLYKNTPEEFTLILVNDGTTEQFKIPEEFLETNGEGKPKNRFLLSIPEHRGVAPSWNEGLKKALELGCNYFVFANNDIKVFRGWLSECLKHFEDGIDIVSIEGHHPVFAGWFFILSLNCIDKVGIFDEQFAPFCFEDTDFAIRSLKAGIKSKILDIPIQHWASATINHNHSTDEYLKVFESNMKKLEAKHPTWIEIQRKSIFHKYNSEEFKQVFENIKSKSEEKDV
jgi:GT2 family glycosyltransferase